MFYELLAEYGPIVLPWLLSFFAATAGAWILRAVKIGWTRDIIARAGGEIKAAVLLVQQTYVDEIKEARADGKLTEIEKKLALSKAREEFFRQFWGAKGLRRLARALGFGSIFKPDEGAASKWVASKVEAEVGAQKLPTKAALLAVPPSQGKS